MVPSNNDSVWSGLAVHMMMNTITYPIEYAKILMQIGHEPIPPRPTVTLFRNPALALPNVFRYVIHIKNVSGLIGCYQGVVPKFCAYSISTVTYKKTYECISFNNEPNKTDDDDDLTEEQRRSGYFHEFLRDMLSRIAGIIVSHPLDVISIRMMAQFVGGEAKYNGLFRSFIEIYKENGIQGYYAGLVPRLIANITLLILTSSSTYAINKYIIRDQEIKSYTAPIMSFLATTVAYPFLVVFHCMAVNDCGLAAGLPPRMPIYKSWLDCWSHLSSTDQLKRGSNLLWRYYTGPQVIINGEPVAINEEKFYFQKST